MPIPGVEAIGGSHAHQIPYALGILFSGVGEDPKISLHDFEIAARIVGGEERFVGGQLADVSISFLPSGDAFFRNLLAPVGMLEDYRDRINHVQNLVCNVGQNLAILDEVNSVNADQIVVGIARRFEDILYASRDAGFEDAAEWLMNGFAHGLEIKDPQAEAKERPYPRAKRLLNEVKHGQEII